MTTQMTLDQRYRKRYRQDMGMNLRMDGELADALRGLAEETGRSQQDLAREAIAEYIRDYQLRAFPKGVRHLLTPPLRPYRRVEPEEMLPASPGWDSVAVIREMRGDR